MATARQSLEFRGLSETLVLQVTGAIVLFGFHVISARLLSLQDYGALSFGLTLGGLLTLGCALGYPDLLLRVVAGAMHQRTWGILKGIVLQAVRNVVLLSAVTVVLLLAASWLLPGIGRDQATGLRIAAVAVAFYPLGFLRAKIARGLGTIRCSIAPEEILRPLTFIGLLLLAVGLVGVTPNGDGLAGLLLVSVTIAMIAGIACVRGHVPFSWASVTSDVRTLEWRRSSRGMMAGGLFQEVITRSDAVALGFLATMASTAQLSACSKLALLNVFLLKVIDSYYAPKMAMAFTSGDNEHLWSLIRRTAAISFAGSLPVAILLVMFPGPLLALFGADYQDATLPLQILAVGTLVNAATGSVGYALLMSNNERVFAIIAGGVATGNVAAHLVFTPTFGIVGAASITAISVALQNLLMLVAIVKLLDRRNVSGVVPAGSDG
ncbi:MAG: oligosaccharide flippase family protein [Gammaproteobacteria bacterium]